MMAGSRQTVSISLMILSLSFFGLAQKRKTEQFQLPATDPASGQQMFRSYCADCHGLDGRGKGPVAVVLTIAPPDLTSLSTRNHGKFPHERVSKMISGEIKITAHGPQDMPIWGPVFARMGSGQRRIKAVADYLASLQQSK